jgi:TruD family tRNA pseudouridine synthase
MDSQEAWKIQQEKIEILKKTNPKVIEPPKRRSEADIFKEIGIWNMPTDKIKGYLRFFNSDFIVEEKTEQGEIIKSNQIIDDIASGREKNEKTLYAHLIKMGISTSDAISRLAQGLNFTGRIGYAGLKDEKALTAQLIAFRDKPINIEELKEKKFLNFILTNCFYGKDFLRPGDLEGNVFTITIRTEKPVDEQIIAAKINNLGKHGFLNYYQNQRFGGVRLDSHRIGQIIMQGKYEEAVKLLLFNINEYEMPVIGMIKKEAEKFYPKFEKIKQLFEKLPYSFLNELKIVEYLNKYPGDFTGALGAAQSNITICLYAYVSLLFNKYLSAFSSQHGCVDEVLPLLLSDDPADSRIYQKYLAEDGTQDFLQNLKPLKFVYLAKRTVPGRIFPKDLHYKIFDGGVVINFTLRKGSYATTFLTNIFELYEDKPVPEWVNNQEIDAKKLLGQGDLSEIKKRLKDSWYTRID